MSHGEARTPRRRSEEPRGDRARRAAAVREERALTELELLETRYEGYITGNDFECDGLAEFEVNGKEAVLRGARFTKESKRIELISCLKLGSSWSVKQLRPDEDCNAPPPEKSKTDDAPRGKKQPKHLK